MFCWTVANNLNSVRFDASLTQVARTLTLRWRVLIGQYQVTWPYYTRKPDTRSNRDTGISLSRALRNSKQAKHTTFYKFQEWFSFAEHRKLVADCRVVLSSTWRWKERIECIFFNSKYAKKEGHFEWKAGKRDGAKKAWVYARKRYCGHLWQTTESTPPPSPRARPSIRSRRGGAPWPGLGYGCKYVWGYAGYG